MIFYKRFLIYLLPFFVFFFACDDEPVQEGRSRVRKEQHASGPVHDQDPVRGGVAVLGLSGEPSNLIPPLASDSASHEVADLIFVAPLRYNKDLELEPWAAEKYTVKDNGTRLRFKLREDIKWFDGEPLTAKDVRFTYELMTDPDTPTAYAEDYKRIEDFRLLDEYTFEVIYEEPFARSLVTWAHAILPRHRLRDQDLMQTEYSRKPMGAGPFRLKEWEAGRRLILEANPDYFLGRPNLDGVIYRIIPDPATMFMELKARNLDMMTLSPQQYLFQTSGEFWEDNFNKYKYLSSSYTYMGYNLDHPLFSDRRVRRALALAIDKEEIVKGVLLGQGVSTIGPYKPGTWVYNEDIQDYGYDPQKASELLEECGWEDRDQDGILDKNGRPFSFTLLTSQGNDLRIKAATIIQYRLQQIGIKMEIRTVEWATFIKEFVDKRRFEALLLGWNIVQDPDLFDVWHSSKIEGRGLNFVGYSNPELDSLLVRGRKTLNRRERKKIYDRVQEILHRDQPYCFLYVPKALPAVDSRFKGIEPAPAGITYNLSRWWVPKARQKHFLQR
ncbi:MAG: peptide-binding protein [Desulfonatronovibrionaceae bacterium]